MSVTLSWYLVGFFGIIFLLTTIRWIADTRRDIAGLPLDHASRTSAHRRLPRDVGTGDGTNGLALARYSEAFAAYLADRGEQALGAAYDLGREAVAAQLSVLDLAEAHHGALRDARAAATDATLQRRPADVPAREPVDVRDRRTAATSRSRRSRGSSTSTSSSCARWPTPRWRSTPSLTVEAILQLTADTARAVIARAPARRSRSSPRTRGCAR